MGFSTQIFVFLVTDNSEPSRSAGFYSVSYKGKAESEYQYPRGYYVNCLSGDWPQ